MRRGFVYLVAVIDWWSRFVLSWRLSTTLDVGFCLDALDEALARARPLIFNSDQGSQFTSEVYTAGLTDAGVRVSRDGRGRALDNVFVERLWRSLKYEEVYLCDYRCVHEAERRIGEYLRFFNHERRHQALDDETPAAVYLGGQSAPVLKVGRAAM